MYKEIKKGRLILLMIFLIVLIIPIVYAFSLLDVLKGGMDSITGRTAITVTITVGNNPPNITDVSINKQTYTPVEGGVRSIEISFSANDTEGLSNLDNTSAKINISLSGTAYNSLNGSCTNSILNNLIKYNCTVQLQYWWDDSSSWAAAAEVKDLNNNAIQNNSATFTYSVATFFNLSSTTLGWGTVTPLQTNQTSTTITTLQNTGNRATLNTTTKIISLYGPSGKNMPAANFTVFNGTSAAKIECQSTNMSAPVTIGVLPRIGVNETNIKILSNGLSRGQNTNPISLYYCLFDVPANVQSETYSTALAGQWDITCGA